MADEDQLSGSADQLEDVDTDEHGAVTFDLRGLGLGFHRVQLDKPAYQPRRSRRRRARAVGRQLALARAARALQDADVAMSAFAAAEARDVLCGVRPDGEVVFASAIRPLELELLRVLAPEGMPLTGTELAVKVSRPRPSVNRALRELALRGLVERSGPRCGPAVNWQSTPAGRSHARAFLTVPACPLRINGQLLDDRFRARALTVLGRQRAAAAGARGARPAHWSRLTRPGPPDAGP